MSVSDTYYVYVSDWATHKKWKHLLWKQMSPKQLICRDFQKVKLFLLTKDNIPFSGKITSPFAGELMGLEHIKGLSTKFYTLYLSSFLFLK